MTIDHDKLEALAREICESKRGEGAWNRYKCKRNYWRGKASEMMALAEAMPPYKTLARACGWLV
jgi:hypothetical protein